MAVWAAAGAAILCFLYYIAIIIYAGFTVSLSWIWLLASGFFSLLALGCRYLRLHPGRIPLRVMVSSVTCLAAFFVVFVVVEFLVFWGAASSAPAGMDYVIVLGAKVRDEGISNSLRRRLDRAIEYSQISPRTVFILSGGQGEDEPEPEAQAMYDYLLYNGVPANRLVMEPVSSSTVENIAYSRVVIERLERQKDELSSPNEPSVEPGPYLEVEDRPLQIGILTSNYHVYRAEMIARKRGIEGIRGIPAPSDILLFPHLCVRECLAILKDRLMGNM